MEGEATAVIRTRIDVDTMNCKTMCVRDQHGGILLEITVETSDSLNLEIINYHSRAALLLSESPGKIF